MYINKMVDIIKSLVRIAVGVLIGYIAFVYCGLYFFQEKLVFQTQDLDRFTVNLINKRAQNAGIQINTPDGKKLHGWFVNNNKSQQVPLVIYFGGNAEEISYSILSLSKHLDGWAILGLNYRGYGLSDGVPAETNLYNDALMLYDWALQREDIDKSTVVVMGRSLGTAVAVHVAANRQPRGVLLVSPYDSLLSIVSEKFWFAPGLSLLLKHHFMAIDSAPSIDVPLFALVAAKDKVIVPSHSKRLIAAWGGTHVDHTIANAHHNNISTYNAYWEKITEFLDGL